MARRCITLNHDDGKCLGHPEVDDERYPPICPRHMEIFMPLIEAKARLLADQMLTERLQSRPGQRRGRRSPAMAMLRPGQTLTDQDRATLDWLRGAA